ncbi:MAG: hypothetical protein HQL09_07150 [Nitrospirae bacterium]|nr:hypothetical protein [Nitrospirota bacterium]
MVDHTWLTMMMGVILLVLVLGILTSIALLIFALVEMKKMSALISHAISYYEKRLDPLLGETEKLVRSMGRIADDAGAVTCAARNVAEAGSDVLINLKALSIILNGLAEGLSLKACGVKAGMKTALGVLINQMKERRSHHER